MIPVRRPRSRISPGGRMAILDAYRRGEKVEVIGVRFGVHFTLPIKMAQRAGIPRERKRGAWGSDRNTEHA